MTEFSDTELSGLTRWVTDELVEIGPLTVRIVSDTPEFPALRYFSRSVRTAVARPGSALTLRLDAEIWCVSQAEPPLSTGPASPGDQTARARGFLSGYYVTDHFGPPVRIVTNGERVLLFGQRLQNLVWPYFVKQLLLCHAVANGDLFLKAGAVAIGDNGTLIVGRGGAGKTVMLSELCRRGAGFVTNSHAIVSGGSVHGVASCLRMRPGPWVDRLAVRTETAIDPAEVIVDPLDAFAAPAAGPVTARNLMVVDFRGPDEHLIQELSETEALGIMEQFGLGLNVYRLEEDLLDRLAGDYCAFSQAYWEMKARLRNLVARCRSYYVVSDVQQSANQDRLLDLLAR
jgi:hypothetical protein